MITQAVFSTFILLLSYPGTVLAGERELCPGVWLRGDFDGGFAGMETRLICGDREGEGPSAEAWRKIPDSQAEFHFKTFLQDKGYYRAGATRDGERLWLDSGPPTMVSSLRVEGAPAALDPGRKRGIVGATLTPALLDEVEGWITSRLRFEGYGCPMVKTRANPETGEVVATVDPGFRQDLTSVFEKSSGGLAPGMLRRYDAFRLGDPYNGEWLTITSRRIVAQGLMDNVYFASSCSNKGVSVEQEAVAGPPRLLSARIGFNTESGPLTRLSWKNARLGRKGSSVDVTLRASFREQSFGTSMTWYYLPEPSRLHLRPTGEILRRDEEFFAELSARARLAAGTSYDDDRVGLSTSLGPAIAYFKTLRGSGPRDSKLVSLDGELMASSHTWELFQPAPREGWMAAASAILNDRRFLSDLSARRVRLYSQWLWNVRDYDPPLWVLGLRGAVSTTLTDERLGPNTLVPPSLRDFLGGSADLRGFGRKELPGSSDGGLTAVFASVEARFSPGLWQGLEPFVFLDAGALGRIPAALDTPLFWSPGAGVRWPSFIGTLRATVAHGYAAGGEARNLDGDSLSHLQIYVSLGEEF